MSSLSNWFSSNHSISGKSLALGAAALSLGSVGVGSLVSNWIKKCCVSCCSLKKESETPVVVVVTGAAGQIGYNIIFSIACGRLLGNRKIELRLVEMPNVLKTLQGIVMELEDCAFPLLTKVVTTDDPRVAFKDADIALLIGAKPRAPGQERNDLLKANAEIFREQGRAINDVAKKTIKVLVVGNPANTNALIAMTNAPSIPKENFSAMTRLDENRAKSQIAKRLNVSVSRLHKISIWGNHSSTQYPSVSHAEFTTDDGKRVPLKSVLNTPADEEYLKKEFISTVQKRGAAVLEAMSRSSAASAANAAVEHVHDWILGTKDNEWASMGVVSDNNGYGVSDGLIYSFPCVCKNGQWTIVKGLPLNSFDNELLQKTERELQEEKAAALSLPPRAAAASASSSSSSSSA